MKLFSLCAVFQGRPLPKLCQMAAVLQSLLKNVGINWKQPVTSSLLVQGKCCSHPCTLGDCYGEVATDLWVWVFCCFLVLCGVGRTRHEEGQVGVCNNLLDVPAGPKNSANFAVWGGQKNLVPTQVFWHPSSALCSLAGLCSGCGLPKPASGNGSRLRVPRNHGHHPRDGSLALKHKGSMEMRDPGGFAELEQKMH